VVKNYKDSSIQVTTSQLRARLIPFFGHMKVKEIELLDVQRFVSGSTKSVGTIRNDVTLLHLMCRKAKKYGYTDRVWDTKDVDFPRDLEPESQPHFTEEQMKLVIAHGGKFQLLYQVLAVTGIRIGEALALKTSDIDAFAQPLPILRVRRSMYKKKEQTPKTTNSYRYFRLPEWLCKELLKAGEGLIFKDKNGQPYGDHAPRYYLGKVKERFGLVGAFHAFRHGQASLMDAANVPSATKQQRMGHGTIGMTNHYTHPNDVNEIQWAQKAGEMFKPERVQ
jgi:integrase